MILIQRHRTHAVLYLGYFGFHDTRCIPFLAVKQLDLYLITIRIGKGGSTIMEVVKYQLIISTNIVSVVDIESSICQHEFHRYVMGIRCHTSAISVHTTRTTSATCTCRSKRILAVSNSSTRRHTYFVIRTSRLIIFSNKEVAIRTSEENFVFSCTAISHFRWSFSTSNFACTQYLLNRDIRIASIYC